MLDKIQEEINCRFDDLLIADDECRKTALSKHSYEQAKYFQTAMFFTQRAKDIVGEIICRHINDGWIPVEERMPEEHPTMFAKLKGTPKWRDSMFEYSSARVNVTVEDEKGKTVTTHAHTIDGKWACDLLLFNKNYKIIAWQPFPEPYRKE